MSRLYRYGVSYFSPGDDEPSDTERAPTPSEYEHITPRDHESRRRTHSSHRSSSHVSVSVTSSGRRRPESRSYETRSPTTSNPEPMEHANADSRAKLDKAERDLAAERSLHDQTRKELDLLRQSLSHEKTALRQAEGDKEKWKRVAGDRQKQLRATTHELNRLIGSTQGFSKMDDSEFRTKADQLRGDIRNMTLCHLEGTDELKISDSTYALFSQRLQLPEPLLKDYLQSSSTRAEVVQAFMWETLRVDIFSRFRWIPQQPSEAMKTMSIFLGEYHTARPRYSQVEQLTHTRLEPFQTPDIDIVPDAKRKFHTWRATTTNIMMEILGLDREQVLKDASKLCQEQASLITNDLSDLLQPSCRGTVEDLLIDIFDQSLILSEMIDTQLASITWSDTKRKHKAGQSDPHMMDFQYEKSHPSHEPRRLVIAPGLVRRGKSSGDSFDVEEVEILPPLIRLAGQTS